MRLRRSGEDGLTGAVNGFDQTAVHDRTFHACVAAVADGFPHLSVAAIINPPHRWFDAALARQVVIHLMVTRFYIPRRRVALMQERSRESVARGIRTIDERLMDDAFASHYAAIERGACTYLQQSRQSEAA